MSQAQCNVYYFLGILTLSLLSTFSCLITEPLNKDAPKSDAKVPAGVDTPKNIPKTSDSQFTSGKIFQDSIGNTIDYGNPKFYLMSGTQSNLSKTHFDEINSQITIKTSVLNTIGDIFKWKQNFFASSAAGGKFIGKTTVNQIMEKKTLTGCHDHGLVFASLLRKYGFPAIMVDTAGIQWAFNYANEKQSGFIGHVFVETYVNERWILINSTSGKYIQNYDPCNPAIPMSDSSEGKGYFALFKGLDPAGYGIASNEQLIENLKMFALNVKSTEISLPQYKIKILP